jgi:hypothetical protein
MRITTIRGSRPSPRARAARWKPFSTARTILALCLLVLLNLLHLFVSAGCSSGAICYRNTDCPYAADCKQGQCVNRVSSEAGAGTSSVNDGAAGEAN